MKKSYTAVLFVFLLLLPLVPTVAQRGIIRSKIKNKIEQDMKEKHAEPQREKGKKALEDITYENDTRYPVPENPVQATLVMKTQTFKRNGKLDETMTTKLAFGKTGEAFIMNEGNKDESRMLFDYKGAATYMVNEKEKTAIKMPMINFQKMAEKMAQQGPEMEADTGKWQRTDEIADINGYKARKYIYTNPEEKTKVDAWVTQDISIDLSGNHLFGGQIKDFSNWAKTDAKVIEDENLPRGLMVRSVYYEKNRDTPSSQMDITSFEKSSDPKYFKLDGYEVMDILGKL